MKKKLISMTPKQFLWTLLPMVVVAIFICVAFRTVTENLIEENVIQRSRASCDYIDVEGDSFFSGRIANLEMIINQLAAGENQSNVLNLIGNISEVQEDTNFYFISADYPANDGFFFSSNYTPAPSVASDLSWYENSIEAEDSYTGTIYEKESEKFLSMSKTVYKANGEVLGVAALEVPVSLFIESTSGILMSAHSIMKIADKNGDIISTEYEENYLTTSPIGKKVLPEEYFDGTEKYQVYGNRYYGIRQFTNYPWFIVAEGPLSDFTGDFIKWFSIVIAITIVLIAGCIVLNAYGMNRMKSNERLLGAKLYGETQNLAVAAKENAATSQDQSTAVKEIVATMEDNNALSENISTKIHDVSTVAGKTFSDVNDGVSAIESNVIKLREIFEANQNTIAGIKSLSTKIENIWDIVTLINSVADQAKIIAFNAELEASSAGEAGKNFHIVATEIRRLADGIIVGTKEIKEKITEIQKSSDSLILASESGTEKINEGCESVKNLEERFTSIKNASEITAESAEDITSIIQQQAVASQQMLITLKQISAGVENFSQATENISNVAQNVQEIAETLNEQNKDESKK